MDIPLRLDVEQGSMLSRDFQIIDYDQLPQTNIYLVTDTFVGMIWPAGATQDSLLAVTPTCGWINGATGAAAGQWRYQLLATDTAALPPGQYKTLVKVVRGSLSATVLDTDLYILNAGSALTPGTSSTVIGLATPSFLGLVSTLWCSDENIAIRCGPDFTPLLPDSQMMAWGSDGVFAGSDPWTLTSASNNFATQLPPLWTVASINPTTQVVLLTQTTTGYVVWLRKPSSAFPAGGHLLAVAGINGQSITLRRLGSGANIGQAPSSSAGLVGVEFQIATFAPQIEEITYDINQRYNIDANLVLRGPADLRDIRPLRRLAVAKVLLDRYTDETRAGTGDYSHKVGLIREEIERLHSKLQLRWGTGIGTIPQTNWFSTRVVR